MADITDIVFAYHMTKTLQSSPLDDVTDFIQYSTAASNITHFDVIHVGNSHRSPEAIVLICTQFSVFFPLQSSVVIY